MKQRETETERDRETEQEQSFKQQVLHFIKYILLYSVSEYST